MEYVYNAQPVRVIDGDTIKFSVKLGFGVQIVETIRLHGVNTPELRSKDKAVKKEAQRATKMVEKFLDCEDGCFLHRDVRLETIKDKKGKYGRYLGIVWLGGKCLNELLKKEGWAAEY